MDSRMKRWADLLLCEINRVTAFHRHGQKVSSGMLDRLSNYQVEAEKALALLTAEPEPCEDARKAFEAWADDTFYLEKTNLGEYTHHSTKKAWEAFCLASHIADKRAEAAREDERKQAVESARDEWFRDTKTISFSRIEHAIMKGVRLGNYWMCPDCGARYPLTPIEKLGDEEYAGPTQYFVSQGELRTPRVYGSRRVVCACKTSCVPDKRLEELRSQVETLREALSTIESESDLPDSGHLGRHGMGDVAREALAATEPKPDKLEGVDDGVR